MAGKEVGSAMWGGRRWPEKTVVEGADAPSGLPPGIGAAIVSLLLVVGGTVTVGFGAGLLWGLGAGLLAVGGIALVIGLLLGMMS